jgi:hypothetical protein
MAKWKQLATVEMLNNAGSIQYQSFSVKCQRKRIQTEDNWHWIAANGNLANCIDTGTSVLGNVTDISIDNIAKGVFAHNLFPLGGTMTVKRWQCSVSMEGWSGSGTDIMYIVPCLFKIVTQNATSYDIAHKFSTETIYLSDSTVGNNRIAFGVQNNAQVFDDLNHNYGVYLGFLMRVNEADLVNEFFNFTFHATYDAIEG